MAHLTLVLQGREIRKFLLGEAATTIGRSQENDIVVNNLALSRRHAQVVLKDGQYQVSDLGSQNGVFVNEQRIDGARVLVDADEVTLGTYHFVFHAGTSVSVKPKPPRKRSSRRGRPKQETTRDDQTRRQAPVRPLLVLKYNDVELQRLSLTMPVCTIGRGKDCDLQVAERRLSRKHCEIAKQGDFYEIRDLGSQNGTYVNRRRIAEKQRLQAGDILNFAEYSVLFFEEGNVLQGVAVSAPMGGAHTEHLDSRPANPAEDTSFPEVSSEELEDLLDAHLDAEEPDLRAALRERAVPVHQPLIREPQAAKERRQEQRRLVQERPVPPTSAREVRRPRPPVAEVLPDVDDDAPEPRPDSQLEAWYDARRKPSKIADVEDSSAMLRGQSSVSRVLRAALQPKEGDRHSSALSHPRRFSIEVVHRGRTVLKAPIEAAVTALGKGEEADLQLHGRLVQGRHSLLVRVRDSLLLVRLGASSAARVNGQAKLQAFLKHGDTIQIDETTIKVVED